CSGWPTPRSTGPRPSGRPTPWWPAGRGPTTPSCGSRTSRPARPTGSGAGSGAGRPRRAAGTGTTARRTAGKGRTRIPGVTSRNSLRTLLNMDMHTVVVGPSGVTESDVLAVARGGARVELSAEAVAALAASREIVDALAAKPDPVYGVSTGFGALATRHISPELRGRLQRNIVRSHAAGMGPRVEREVVRALMFLRLKTLCSGRTG